MYIYKKVVFLVFPKEKSLVNTIMEYDSLWRFYDFMCCFQYNDVRLISERGDLR